MKIVNSFSYYVSVYEEFPQVGLTPPFPFHYKKVCGMVWTHLYVIQGRVNNFVIVGQAVKLKFDINGNFLLVVCDNDGDCGGGVIRSHGIIPSMYVS